ncbi:MAG: hypothetical protein AB1599_04605 [Planctomycetota bacterium]
MVRKLIALTSGICLLGCLVGCSREDEINNLKAQHQEEVKILKEKNNEELKTLKEKNNELLQSMNKDKQTLISEYTQKTEGLNSKHNEELKTLKDENAKLSQLLNDPTKRIPNLLERTKILSKELLGFYQEKDKQLLSELSNAKDDYQSARNDPNVFIDYEKCLSAKEKIQGLTDGYKSYSKSYQEFLTDKEPELASSGIDIASIKTAIAKNLSNNDEFSRETEKAMGLIRKNDIVVNADKGWQPANMTVSIGDTVYVVAKGEWSIRTNGPKIDADGEGQPNKEYCQKGFESVKLGALICKIAGDDDVLMKKKEQCGKKFFFKVPLETGQLYFSINDTDTSNNHGMMNVRVIVVKKQ